MKIAFPQCNSFIVYHAKASYNFQLERYDSLNKLKEIYFGSSNTCDFSLPPLQSSWGIKLFCARMGAVSHLLLQHDSFGVHHSLSNTSSVSEPFPSSALSCACKYTGNLEGWRFSLLIQPSAKHTPKKSAYVYNHCFLSILQMRKVMRGKCMIQYLSKW